MKITREEIKKAEECICKIDIDIDDSVLFFPLDLTIRHTDEFGIETKVLKAETHYGDHVVPGLSHNGNGVRPVTLSYAATTSMVSFNLMEYLDITYQHSLTEEEKNYISQFECGLVKKNQISTTKAILK